MSATHTPGPWACASGGRKGEFTVYLPGDGMVVCSRNQYDEKHAEFLANARLIAAAPELLETLQAIHDSAPQCWWNLPIEMQQRVKAALAKATGSAS